MNTLDGVITAASNEYTTIKNAISTLDTSIPTTLTPAVVALPTLPALPSLASTTYGVVPPSPTDEGAQTTYRPTVPVPNV